MPIEALIARSIDCIFDKTFSSPAVASFGQCGPYLLQLLFAETSLANRLLSSYPPAKPGKADLTVGFLTSAQADLSHLVPQPPDQYRFIAGADCFAVWQPADLPMLHLLDRKTNRAVVWFGAGAAPDWFANLPGLPMMHALSIGTPWAAIHAAAVGRNDRTLLLAGNGHVGKTTAAVACARAGWDYAGDDYVYANTLTSRIEPLYCSARLRADMASAFPDLIDSAAARRSDGELRYELRLPAQLRQAEVRGGALAAILLPRRRGAKLPTFSAARRFDAVPALYTSMTLVQFGWPEAIIKKIAAIIGLAPVFFVDTGQNTAAIPEAFAEFLDRL